MLRIGVDVGGTNTDAVLMDGLALRAWAKTPTTSDVTSGIVASVHEALARAEISKDRVRAVMLGTTHFTNALVERQHLAPTAVVRLGLPATAAVPPLEDWPDDLRMALAGRGYLAHGGYEFDGRPIAPIDPDELLAIAREIGRNGIRAVAVCAVFSPIRPDVEQQAEAIMAPVLPGVRFSLSHQIGRLGLLERENACALNACLGELADHTVSAIQAALGDLGLAASLFLSQNDGTLMSANFARQYPVLTFASGPTNSTRGAAYLSGLRDALVVDIGGTTTDVGALTGGFPREASAATRVGGVRTNFRMPDVLSLGLGGGSLIRTPPLRVGPDSVGYRLTEEAIIFGGSVFTATDAVVAVGASTLGDASRLGPGERELAAPVLDLVRTRLAESIDQVKLSAEPLPVVLVGGGSIIFQGSLAGASEVVRPQHFEVANAIGAAIAQVSGEVDHVRSLDGLSRTDVLQEARALAEARALEAGADGETLDVVEAEDVPLAYLPGNAPAFGSKLSGICGASMWRVDADTIESLALGAGILGTGGGGNPYVARVWARYELRRGARFEVIDPDELVPDSQVVASGGIGAPTVSVEKLRRGDEELRALRALEGHMRVTFAALVPMEVGGSNAIRPLITAAQAGIPTIDADGMGRAFPELQMVTYFMYGVPACPFAMADDKGDEAVLTGAPSPQRLERLARALTIEMGGTAGMAMAPMTARQLRRTAIPRTLTVAREVGDTVRAARRWLADPVEALLEATGGCLLFSGKITDVERRTTTGFARGRVTMRGTGSYGSEMHVDFQNENLVARVDDHAVAMVPDLICIVASDDAEPITTEMLRYGQRVAVIGIPCHPMLSTPEALAIVGPRAFGYSLDFVPLQPSGRLPWTTFAE